MAVFVLQLSNWVNSQKGAMTSGSWLWVSVVGLVVTFSCPVGQNCYDQWVIALGQCLSYSCPVGQIRKKGAMTSGSWLWVSVVGLVVTFSCPVGHFV